MRQTCLISIGAQSSRSIIILLMKRNVEQRQSSMVSNEILTKATHLGTIHTHYALNVTNPYPHAWWK